MEHSADKYCVNCYREYIKELEADIKCIAANYPLRRIWTNYKIDKPKDKMKNELKPCPFCGSEAYAKTENGHTTVHCINLECPLCWHIFELHVWNTRYPDEEQK